MTPEKVSVNPIVAQVRAQQARRNGHVAGGGLTPDMTSTTLPSGIAHQLGAQGDAAAWSDLRPEASSAGGLSIQPARMIPLALIDDSPYQTRTEPDAAWLAELQESLRTKGQANPCLIRASSQPGRWEFIAGHTRGQAARALGWTEIRCEIAQNCDDVSAAALVLIDNEKRRELTVLDKAKGLQRLKEVYAAAGKTQAQLAGDQRLAESTISNQLRLLKLPDVWQQRLLAGELHIDQARALVRWVDYSKFFEGFAAHIKNCGLETGPIDNHHFESSRWHGIEAASRTMTQREYGASCAFKPTADQLAELDVHEVSTNYGSKEKRAFNVALWTKLQREAKAKQKQRAAAKGTARQSVPLSPAIPRHTLEHLWADWFRRRLAERVPLTKLTKAQRDQLWKVVLIMQNDCFVEDVNEAFGLKHTWQQRHLTIQTILHTAIDEIEEVLIGHFLKELTNLKRTFFFNGAGEARAIAELFGVSLETWEPDADFLEGLPQPVLTTLAEEQSIQVEKTAAKQVAKLLELWQPGCIPEVLDVFPKPAAKSPRPKKSKAAAK